MINTHEDSLNAWEANAMYWDNYMGDESNSFHCNAVRPYTEKLLGILPNDVVLDIACGNGNFSSRLALEGASVTAFDYSSKMIELAKKRRADILDKVDFRVCDATKIDELLALKGMRPFTKAVANMAIMDISDIKPLFNALYKLLDNNGIFVFSTHHPCFEYPNNDYLKEDMSKGIAIEGQPLEHNYYHRTLEQLFNTAFKAGFVLDSLHEIPYDDKRVPIIIICRLRKL